MTVPTLIGRINTIVQRFGLKVVYYMNNVNLCNFITLTKQYNYMYLFMLWGTKGNRLLINALRAHGGNQYLQKLIKRTISYCTDLMKLDTRSRATYE